MSESVFNIDYDALAAAVAAMPKPIEPGHWVAQFFREKILPALPGYEVRTEQIRMAKTIARGLAERKHVIVEAGTGTGKSLAYLVPVIRHCQEQHCRAIVSTGTIALQEQLINKDLPLLAKVFPDLRYALAKGKANYVCPLKLNEEWHNRENPSFAPLLIWARATETGDRSEYPDDPGPDWTRICVDDSCPGLSKCPRSGDCFYARARAQWDQADVIVTNHALLCIHLQLQSMGAPGILPEAAVVVLDEAHHLEDEAREAFAIQVSSLRLPMLFAQAAKLAEIPAEDIEHLRQINDALFTVIRGLSSEQMFTLTDVPDSIYDLIENLRVAIIPILRLLRADEENVRAIHLAEQIQEAFRDIAVALDLRVDPGIDAKNVTWVEVNRYRDSERITLHQTPVDVAPLLQSALWDAYDSVIATSATLTTGGHFRYWRQATGCPADALELVVDSPFDYYNQCLLYIPNDLPEPKDNPLYYSQIAPRIEQILEKTDGRAFVLFTSYRGLQETYDLLSPRLRWQVLKQGDGPKQELLRRFKEDGHAVLFGTSSFWEGVDVPGEALSCVIITALPFSVPTDPVQKARAEAIAARYGERATFTMLSLPEMILRLKQGFGRLIRAKTDRGLVAILDRRVWTKSYGGEVLRSLPHCRQIGSLENVEAFLAGDR